MFMKQKRYAFERIPNTCYNVRHLSTHALHSLSSICYYFLAIVHVVYKFLSLDGCYRRNQELAET